MIRACIAIALALSAAPAGPYQDEAPAVRAAERPNFVLLLADDQSWNGTEVPMIRGKRVSRSDHYRTPNLLALARSGMRFSRAYSAGPNCTPSRAALLTGSSPIRLHMTTVVKDDDPIEDAALATPPEVSELPSETVTIAELLGEAGYRTAHFGKWHLGDVDPTEHGFDEALVLGPDPLDTAASIDDDPKQVFSVSKRAAAFIEEASEAGEPFYVQVGYKALHRPFQARSDTIAIERLRPKGRRHTDSTYAAMTFDLDAAVEVVVAKVRELGLEGTTYVIYTSDNGAAPAFTDNTPLRDGKGTLFEGGIRVPLFVSGPTVAPGSACDHPVVGQDLFATIADWAGVAGETADTVDGVSLARTIASGGEEPIARPAGGIAFHFPHYARRTVGIVRPCSAWIEGDLKLVRFDGPREVMLYDLGEEWGERTDVREQRPEEAAALERRLDERLASLGAAFADPRETR